MKRKSAIIISGGGSFGAFGAGTLQRLNKNYDVGAGISTGALMLVLVMLNEWERLKQAYTSVRQKDIIDLKWYKPNPFNKKGNPNALAIILAIITGSKTISTSKNLKKLIDQFITKGDYDKLRELQKNTIVGTQNINQKPSRIHYFDILDTNFKDFKNWIWASANAPFFMSILEKEWEEDGNKYFGQWTDGGLTELVALDAISNLECNEIDVIIHREFPKEIYECPNPIENLIHNVGRNYNAMRYDIEFEELLNKAKDLSEKGTKIRLIYLPRKLGDNSLLFNKKQMIEWWEEGYNTAFDKNRILEFNPN